MNWLKRLLGAVKPGATRSPETPVDDELAFFRLLGPEVGSRLCKQAGCDRKNVEHSVMCRRHHFQMIKGKPCPFPDDAYVEVRSREELNLLRWKHSGEPDRWIEERSGAWDHDAWMALLRELGRSEFWPMEVDDVGELLDRLKWEWQKKRQAQSPPRSARPSEDGIINMSSDQSSDQLLIAIVQGAGVKALVTGAKIIKIPAYLFNNASK